MKNGSNIIKILATAVLLCLVAAACSSSGDESSASSTRPIPVTTRTTVPLPSTSVAPATTSPNAERLEITVPFEASNGEGTVTISGSSPIVVWFGSLPGDVSLDLVDANVDDVGSVVEELVSFWFFQDDSSGDVPPSILVSASGEISDSLGTRYDVVASGLLVAPGTEEQTTDGSTTPSTTKTTILELTDREAAAIVPATSIPQIPETTTTTTSTTTTTTTTIPKDMEPGEVKVLVLNGSGVNGAAGRLSARLREAGYATLPAANAPARSTTSAVYYVDNALEDDALRIATASGGNGLQVLKMPDPPLFVSETEPAHVFVLIGADSLAETVRPTQQETALRPRVRNDIALPLAPEVPRDRYVPGLANINIFSEINDQGPDLVQGNLGAIAGWMNILQGCNVYNKVHPTEDCILWLNPQNPDETTNAYLNLERAFEWFGFTPQNVCGAPAGYSFTDLIKPASKFDPETGYYSGDFITSTDELLSLPGASESERINPEGNWDYYLKAAAQAGHDAVRLHELIFGTANFQLILCVAWLMPSSALPLYAHNLRLLQWGTIDLPLVSQGTYHIHYMSRNGNAAGGHVCHPDAEDQNIVITWRYPGYKVTLNGPSPNRDRTAGCYGSFTEHVGNGRPLGDPAEIFDFGERTFTADELLPFPRAQ